MRLKVYIAGPYSKGDVAANVVAAMNAWHTLWKCGFSPYCPHLSHFLHIHHQLPYEAWLDYDKEWMVVCDAVLRLRGESSGADKETNLAEMKGIPVFHELYELVEWREKTHGS